jgi:hypothetical protein
MALNLQLEEKEAYLLATVSGEFDLREAKQRLPEFFETVRAYEQGKCLIDARNLTGRISLMERYEFARFMAEITATKIRIAVVAAERHVWRDRFFETAAVNRGIVLKVTTSVEEGEEWLLTQPA